MQFKKIFAIAKHSKNANIQNYIEICAGEGKKTFIPLTSGNKSISVNTASVKRYAKKTCAFTRFKGVFGEFFKLFAGQMVSFGKDVVYLP